MADDFYGYDDEGDEPKGRDNLFLWTVFILLLIGGAFACWLGSFYIFGHPENPRAYKILKKLNKLEAPQRFEVTAAPPGEFLNPQKLYERYAKFTRLELENENGELIRTYLRNYKETKRLVTYATGKFVVLNAVQLKQTDLFPNGVDLPQVLIEHVYTANAANVRSLLALLQTGAPIRIVRTDDLSAVVHVERLHDGRMQFTLVPLLYGSYGVTGGPGQFSLEPPTELNMAPGLPVIKGADLEESLKRYTAYRAGHPAESTETAGDGGKPAATQELVRVDVVEPGEKVPLTGTMQPPPVATPIMIPGKATPKPATPRFAGGPKPTPKASPTPGKMVMLTTPQPHPIPTPAPPSTPALLSTPVPAPVTTPAPVVPETPRVSPTGVELKPFIKAQRDPREANSGATWKTYAPGQAPPAKVMGLDDIATLADRGEIGERIYLRGDFRVTASSSSRAVLRDANKPDDQSPRVLVEYPSGAVPPQEKDRLSRDSSRPYQIYNVRRGADGVVTIWVREITQ